MLIYKISEITFNGPNVLILKLKKIYNIFNNIYNYYYNIYNINVNTGHNNT